mgnify:CR=1 FL=1
MKKLLFTLLVGLVALGTAFGAGTQDDGAADGGPTTVTVMTTFQAVQENADFDNLFFTRYIEQELNLEIDWDTIPVNVNQERVNIAFAAGDMSDLLFGGGIINPIFGEAVRTGQLMPIGDMLENGDGWVNLPQWPEFRPVFTHVDGEIYAVGRGNFFAASRNAGGRYFWNRTWAEELGFEWPIDTLEEMTELLYAMKEDKPDLYPVSGRWQNRRVTGLFQLAHGLKTNMWGFGLASEVNIVDGEVVFSPLHENFPAYLEYANQLYQDEILDPEYFTQQMGQLRARMAEHGFGLYSEGAPGTALGMNESVYDYWHATPVTSEYNQEAYWPEQTPLQRNSAAIYAFAEEPEAAFQILDFVGTPEGSLMDQGYIHPDWLEGMDIEALIPEGASEENIVSELNSDGTIAQAAIPEGVQAWSFHNTFIWPRASNIPVLRNTGFDWEVEVKGPVGLDPEKPADWYHYNSNQTLGPVFRRWFTARDIVWTTEEQEVIDLYEQEMIDYIDEWHAKFIIGAEPLSAYDSFVESLDGYGLQELLEVYQAAYDRWAAMQ